MKHTAAAIREAADIGGYGYRWWKVRSPSSAFSGDCRASADADGVGTNEIMRRTGKSKTCVWRWQERFMKEGIDGLLHDKTRPSRPYRARSSRALIVVFASTLTVVAVAGCLVAGSRPAP